MASWAGWAGRAEDRRQKTGDRRWKTEDGRQEAEDRRQEIEDRAGEQGNRGPGQQVIVGLWAAGDDD